jgi:hypothetical protein
VSYAKEAALKFDLGQSAVSVAGGRSSTSGTPSPGAARARHKQNTEREAAVGGWPGATNHKLIYAAATHGSPLTHDGH